MRQEEGLETTAVSHGGREAGPQVGGHSARLLLTVPGRSEGFCSRLGRLEVPSGGVISGSECPPCCEGGMAGMPRQVPVCRGVCVGLGPHTRLSSADSSPGLGPRNHGG